MQRPFAKAERVGHHHGRRSGTTLPSVLHPFGVREHKVLPASFLALEAPPWRQTAALQSMHRCSEAGLCMTRRRVCRVGRRVCRVCAPSGRGNDCKLVVVSEPEARDVAEFAR